MKVTDGPFNGFHGNIEEVNEEKKKLKVMVKIFGAEDACGTWLSPSRERKLTTGTDSRSLSAMSLNASLCAGGGLFKYMING